MFPQRKTGAKWKFIILFYLLVLSLIGGIYAVLYSSLLQVRSFKVVGATMVDEKKFLASLAIQKIAEKKVLGFLGPQNIFFWVGSDNLNGHLLPQVDEINVDVNLVGRSVKVSVEEKDMFGVICTAREECFLFDRKGFVFSRAPSVRGPLIIRIDDPHNRPLVLGERFLPEEKMIKNLFETLGILQKAGFKIYSASLRKLELREWQVKLAEGPRIYFSFNFVPEDLENILTAVKKRLDIARLSYIDLRVPGRLYYK